MFRVKIILNNRNLKTYTLNKLKNVIETIWDYDIEFSFHKTVVTLPRKENNTKIEIDIFNV